TRSHQIEPGGKKLVRDQRSDPETAGRVLRIRDGKLDFFSGDDLLQVASNQSSPRRGEYVADEENVHECRKLGRKGAYLPARSAPSLTPDLNRGGAPRASLG